jgi:hypothetical protein
MNYEQKKGHESNSRPLKVKNRPDFLVFRRRATYHWKALNEGYTFALDHIAIGILHMNLCAFKVGKVPVVAISRFLLGSLETKNHLDVAPVESCRV